MSQEGQRSDGAQHGVEPRPTNSRPRRLTIDAALELDARHNRDQYGPFCVTTGSPSRRWIATSVSSRNATVRGLRVGKLFVVTHPDGGRTRQRLETRNHLRDGGCRAVEGDHISRAYNDEFDALTEGDILRQSDCLGVAAPERAGLGVSPGI